MKSHTLLWTMQIYARFLIVEYHLESGCSHLVQSEVAISMVAFLQD